LNPLVQPDPGLFIWTIVTFLVLLALLTKFAWKPLLGALDRRHERIRDSLDEARRANEETQKLRQDAAEILRNAHAEAHAIVSSSRTDGERIREEIKQKARADAAAIVVAAERRIELEKARAREEVRAEAVDLSILIASKLLRRNITVEDDRLLIDDLVRSFGEQRH
jgi:F-type H+-transporting ATPase subunit b